MLIFLWWIVFGPVLVILVCVGWLWLLYCAAKLLLATH